MRDVVLSAVLAPADAAVWARPEANLLAPTKRSDYFQVNPTNADRTHACTPACPQWPTPYTGPIRLGRAGEQITPGRAVGEFLTIARVGVPHSARRYRAGCRCLICTAAFVDEQRAAESRRPRRVKSTAPHGTAERASGRCRCEDCRRARRDTTTAERPS